MLVFARHRHESGARVPRSQSPHIPRHPILGCPRALALSALLHALNLHWSSVSHMVMKDISMLFSQIILPLPSPQDPKVCSLHVCPVPFFIRIALAIQDFLCFHTNSEIICSSSMKNTIGSLIGIALNL